MKFILILATLFASLSSYACSCSDYPLSHEDTIKEFVSNEYRYRSLSAEAPKWIKYYPAIDERLFYKEYKGTSCEGAGPNNEILLHCTSRRKSDYLIKMKDCEAVVQVSSTKSKISIKQLSTTCKN